MILHLLENGISEGTIRILMKKEYIIRVGEDRHEGELGVLFRDVDEDNYIGRLYTLPDEKSVSFGGELNECDKNLVSRRTE